MDKEKELKFRKILQYHKAKGIITKKQYKKELEFIELLKKRKNGEGK